MSNNSKSSEAKLEQAHSKMLFVLWSSFNVLTINLTQAQAFGAPCLQNAQYPANKLTEDSWSPVLDSHIVETEKRDFQVETPDSVNPNIVVTVVWSWQQLSAVRTPDAALVTSSEQYDLTSQWRYTWIRRRLTIKMNSGTVRSLKPGVMGLH